MHCSSVWPKASSCLLPASTQFETFGSVTASNRSVEWRSRIIEPLFGSLPDHTILYKFAKKFGFEQALTKHIAVNDDEPSVEDVTRQFNRGAWTIGYTEHSPERLKRQQENWHTFNTTTLKAQGGPCDGEFYGLSLPCWASPEVKHPGWPILYDTVKTVVEGGLPFRARFGVERKGVGLLADGSWTKGSDIQDGWWNMRVAAMKHVPTPG